jgi:hypothetical protein
LLDNNHSLTEGSCRLRLDTSDDLVYIRSYDQVLSLLSGASHFDADRVLNKLYSKVQQRLAAWVDQMPLNDERKHTLKMMSIRMKTFLQKFEIDLNEQVQNLDLDLAKLNYLRAVMMLICFAEKCYHEEERSVIYLVFRQVLALSLRVPDHVVTLATFEHIGYFCQTTGNYPGALKAFQKMRDVAEDCNNKEKEMAAYLYTGKVLERMTEYK